MITIAPAGDPDQFAAAAALLSAFAAWDAAQAAQVGLEPQLVLDLFHADEDQVSLMQKFAAQDAALLLAYQDGDCLGTLGIAPFDTGRMELHSFYIDPAARGQGIGRRLIEAAVDFAVSQGQQTLLVQTTVYMQAALSLYHATGFAPAPPFRQIPDAVTATERFFSRPLPGAAS
ncbi:hypothetical protein BJF92_04660 [Rhizobium rhizosphaerae]|uniref:N-acetyltransferase domain-containing protein n=1 Tax=Xaviernesmea rhizosphaerae TaxID=1672749 RepID=A0A1Q9AFX1_9HYPH|nr:GNAT family N-acetyltransferase [Xaviernesmea rhizosphaerae]OLP53878.1 hypothetical protein BJF92_04660 [Xaviernesmea rhizosphaerae]